MTINPDELIETRVPSPADLAAMIKSLREENKWSQATLAEIARLTDRTNHGALWSLNKRRDRLLMELVLAGLLSIAAVRSCEVERRPCGPFTIGKSAIGGCDYIAGRERF
jgi:hypothetical protein